jgi:hypothetical protein
MSWIVAAKYLEKYLIEVRFEDGLTKIVDLEPFLKKSKDTIIKRFLEVDRFKEVRVEYGTVCWGKNEFDLNPFNVYRGDFDATKHSKEQHCRLSTSSNYSV